MRKIICYIAGLFLSVACDFSSRPFMTVLIEGAGAGETVFVELGQQCYHLKTDSLGYVSIGGKEITEPVKGELKYKKYRLPLYVEPSKTFEVYLNVVGSEPGVEFSGIGALKNEVWNGRAEPLWNKDDFLLPDGEFIAVVEQWKQQYRKALDSLQLDAAFTALVQQKINCRVLDLLNQYLSVRKNDQEMVGEYGVRFIKQHESDFCLQEGRSLLYRWAKLFVGANSGLTEERSLEEKLQFVDTLFRNTILKEYLIDRFMTEYVNRGEGNGHYEELNRVYRTRVQDKARREQFEALTREWKKLEAGQSVPDFQGMTLDSTEMSLKDFTGKYIYLLIWSVDCKRSVRAVSGLKELHQRLKKKDISFVAVCCSPDRAEWQKLVRELELGGVQLYIAPDALFLKACKVTELPRFIVINPVGKIVEAYAGAPWKSSIVEELNAGMEGNS